MSTIETKNRINSKMDPSVDWFIVQVENDAIAESFCSSVRDDIEFFIAIYDVLSVPFVPEESPERQTMKFCVSLQVQTYRSSSVSFRPETGTPFLCCGPSSLRDRQSLLLNAQQATCHLQCLGQANKHER